MLMRMYTRWAEIYHNFKVEVVEKLDGDAVGIKSTTIKIIGEKAYGWAKAKVEFIDWLEYHHLMQMVNVIPVLQV